MNIEALLKYSDIAVFAVCAITVLLMARRRILSDFPALAILLAVQGIDIANQVGILFFRRSLGIEISTAYNILFFGHWSLVATSVVLRILVIYSVFRMAMRPLQGLHQIGKIVFRWVAAVSVMVSAAIAAGPHVVSPGYNGTVIFTSIVSEAQQGISVLTICLLLFVCFSIKPLGLTYRSRIFGISLGLGILATTSLVQAAWASLSVGRSLYSPIYVFGAFGMLVATSVWTAYFAFPEPERKLILLPTTSPFFFWNRISEALGDAPGHVAIAGFRPDMLAVAEMQMFSAPSVTRIGQPAEEFNMPAVPQQLLQATASR
jgi:hypothetical protein